MRHRRAGVHLSRPTAHRKALFSNLVAALLTNERIRTTDAKAKETRRLAERTITWARRLGDVLTKKAERRSAEESARVVHAVRMARRIVRDRTAVSKLFNEIGPRYLARRGGYTRIVKIGQRPGDAAPMSLLELIPDGVAGRRRRPRVRVRGRKGATSRLARPRKAARRPPPRGARPRRPKRRIRAPRRRTKPASAKAEGGAKPAAKKKAK